VQRSQAPSRFIRTDRPSMRMIYGAQTPTDGRLPRIGPGWLSTQATSLSGTAHSAPTPPYDRLFIGWQQN